MRASIAINLLLHNKKALLLALIEKMFVWLPDKPYLKLQFWLRMGYPLNLNNPKLFSEKIQWLKLNDRRPLYTNLVDKYNVKSYVSTIVGRQYIIPTLGLWDNAGSIEWESLPSQFVLKTTHGGGSYGVIICKDKASFDKTNAERKLKKALRQNIYKSFREWPYKNVKPSIIAEQYMEQNGESDLIDYKFFCFNGEPHFLYVRWTDSFDKKKHVNYVLPGWEPAPFYRPDCMPSKRMPAKPLHFDEMCSLARKLSKGFPFVRVDFYEINDKVYFSELTFYPSSGFSPFEPICWDKRIGDLLLLPNEDEHF